MTITKITIRYDADLRGTLASYDDPEAVLGDYLDRAQDGCRAQWPEADISVDYSQAGLSGATKRSEALCDDGLPADGADADALDRILHGALDDAQDAHGERYCVSYRDEDGTEQTEQADSLRILAQKITRACYSGAHLTVRDAAGSVVGWVGGDNYWRYN